MTFEPLSEAEIIEKARRYGGHRLNRSLVHVPADSAVGRRVYIVDFSGPEPVVSLAAPCAYSG